MQNADCQCSIYVNLFIYLNFFFFILTEDSGLIMAVIFNYLAWEAFLET